jgi:hypothetical protein
MVYMYIVKHNYILGSMFTNTKAQLHVSAINVGHLQVVHTNVCGEFTVCGVGGVRDLVLCRRKGRGQGLFRDRALARSLNNPCPCPFLRHKTRSRTHPTPQTVNSPHTLV